MNAISGFLTVEDVRRALLDLDARDDNRIDLDLEFTDEEIREAMIQCVRAYHDLAPPGIARMDPALLPRDTRVFLDGTIRELLLSSLARLGRNSVAFSAGGVSTDLVGARQAATRELYQVHAERFERAARLRLAHISAGSGFRIFH